MSQKFQFSVFTFCIFTVKYAFGANILYLCALPSPSHQIWYILRWILLANAKNHITFLYRNIALANGLAARGHNITIISPDIDKNPPKGVHHIYLEGIYNDEWRALQKHLFTYTADLNPLTEPINYNNYWTASCES